MALCLIFVTLLLLGVPDEADLQPARVTGLQPFSGSVDDVEDGDANGRHVAVLTGVGVVFGNRPLIQSHESLTIGICDRIETGDNISLRGPPLANGAKKFHIPRVSLPNFTFDHLAKLCAVAADRPRVIDPQTPGTLYAGDARVRSP